VWAAHSVGGPGELALYLRRREHDDEIVVLDVRSGIAESRRIAIPSRLAGCAGAAVVATMARGHVGALVSGRPSSSVCSARLFLDGTASDIALPAGILPEELAIDSSGALVVLLANRETGARHVLRRTAGDLESRALAPGEPAPDAVRLVRPALEGPHGTNAVVFARDGRPFGPPIELGPGRAWGIGAASGDRLVYWAWRIAGDPDTPTRRDAPVRFWRIVCSADG
jgi:hypothetical protein